MMMVMPPLTIVICFRGFLIRIPVTADDDSTIVVSTTDDVLLHDDDR